MQPFHKVLTRALGRNIGHLLGCPNLDFGQVARKIINGTDTYYSIGGKKLLLDDSTPWNAFHILREMIPNTSNSVFSNRGVDLDSQMTFVLFGYLNNIDQDNVWTILSAFSDSQVIYKGSSPESTFTGYASFRRVSDHPVEIAQKYGLQIEKVQKNQTELVALEIDYTLTLIGAKKRGKLFTFTVTDGSNLQPTIPSTCCPQNNLNASAEPTNTDDYSSGYRRGSEWIFDGEAYYCVDPTTGAAVWEHMTFSVDDANSLYSPISHTHDYSTLLNLPTLFQSVQGGVNITIDNTDPQNPIINASGGGGGTPGGADAQIQYNNSGAFGGISELTYESGTDETDTYLDFNGVMRGEAFSIGQNTAYEGQAGRVNFYYRTFPDAHIGANFGNGDERRIKFGTPAIRFSEPDENEIVAFGGLEGDVEWMLSTDNGNHTAQLGWFLGGNVRFSITNYKGAGTISITTQNGIPLYGNLTSLAPGQSAEFIYSEFDGDGDDGGGGEWFVLGNN